MPQGMYRLKSFMAMRLLNTARAKLLALESGGPFSYLAFPRSERITVLSSIRAEGEYLLITVPAKTGLRSQIRNEVISELDQALAELMKWRFQLPLSAIQRLAATLRETIAESMRYEEQDENEPRIENEIENEGIGEYDGE